MGVVDLDFGGTWTQDMSVSARLAIGKLILRVPPDVGVRLEVQRAFDSEMQSRLSTSVWQTGCNNWYLDEHGRNTNNWPGFTLEYRRRTRRLDPSDYEAQLSTSGL